MAPNFLQPVLEQAAALSMAGVCTASLQDRFLHHIAVTAGSACEVTLQGELAYGAAAEGSAVPRPCFGNHLCFFLWWQSREQSFVFCPCSRSGFHNLFLRHFFGSLITQHTAHLCSLGDEFTGHLSILSQPEGPTRESGAQTKPPAPVPGVHSTAPTDPFPFHWTPLGGGWSLPPTPGPGEALHFAVMASSRDAVDAAVRLCRDLLRAVRQQLAHYRSASGGTSLDSLPPCPVFWTLSRRLV